MLKRNLLMKCARSLECHVVHKCFKKKSNSSCFEDMIISRWLQDKHKHRLTWHITVKISHGAPHRLWGKKASRNSILSTQLSSMMCPAENFAATVIKALFLQFYLFICLFLSISSGKHCLCGACHKPFPPSIVMMWLSQRPKRLPCPHVKVRTRWSASAWQTPVRN